MYLSLSGMSASLELDGAISVGGMGSRVLVRQPEISSDSDIDADDNRVRGSVLTAAASVELKELKSATQS